MAMSSHVVLKTVGSHRSRLQACRCGRRASQEHGLQRKHGPKLIGSQGLVQDTQPCPHTHRPKSGATPTHTHTHVRQAHTSQNAPSCADPSDIFTTSVRHQWRLIQITSHPPTKTSSTTMSPRLEDSTSLWVRIFFGRLAYPSPHARGSAWSRK